MEMFNGEMVIWSEIGGEWPLQASAARVPCWCGFHEQPGREGPMYRMVEAIEEFTDVST
jgi:hypothetical protein